MSGIFNKQVLNGSIFSGFGTVGSLGTPEEDCSSRAGALWDPAKGTCGPDPEAGLEDRCGYIGGQWSDQQICERLPETTVTPFLEGCNATGGGIVDNDFCDYALTATGRQAELAPTFDLNVQQSRPWWHYAIAGGLAFIVGKWIVRKLAKKRSFAANGRRRASEPPVWEDDFPPWAMEKERARHGQTKRLRAAGAVIRSRAAARRKMKAAAKAYFKEHGHLFKPNTRSLSKSSLHSAGRMAAHMLDQGVAVGIVRTNLRNRGLTEKQAGEAMRIAHGIVLAAARSGDPVSDWTSPHERRAAGHKKYMTGTLTRVYNSNGYAGWPLR